MRRVGLVCLSLLLCTAARADSLLEDILSGMKEIGVPDDAIAQQRLQELKCTIEKSNALNRPAEEQARIDAAAAARAAEFETSYLNKFFPRPLVMIEEYFQDASPEAIDEFLKKIVVVFAQQPWFWFKNDQKKCRIGEHWEEILENFFVIAEFLGMQAVYLDDGSTVPASDDRLGTRAMVPLGNYLKDKGRSGAFDFCALWFDYLIKMFNEGICFKDVAQARMYKTQLQRVFYFLRGSKYEAGYSEAMKRCKDLLALLQKSEQGSEE